MTAVGEVKSTNQRDQSQPEKHRARALGRTKLAHAVYRTVGVSKLEAANMVEQVLEEILNAIGRGEPVKLASFGIFHVRDKTQRKGRNPKTMVEFEIPPRRVIAFRPSRILKARMNGAMASDEEQ